MTHPYWPLFDLRVRSTRLELRLELRLPDDDDLVALARLAAGGIHDPGAMPFIVPWTEQPSPRLERQVLQFQWRARAEWATEHWRLPLLVSHEGEPVGVQDTFARDFVVTRTVETGSWLGRAHQGRGIGREMRAAVLELAFRGLGAQAAVSAAFADNPASSAVSHALGYEDNGIDVVARGGLPARLRRLRLSRERWEATHDRSRQVEIEGLEPCLELFGLGSTAHASRVSSTATPRASAGPPR